VTRDFTAVYAFKVDAYQEQLKEANMPRADGKSLRSRLSAI